MQKSDFYPNQTTWSQSFKKIFFWKSKKSDIFWNRNQSLHKNVLRFIIWVKFINEQIHNLDLKTLFFFRFLRPRSSWKKIVSKKYLTRADSFLYANTILIEKWGPFKWCPPKWEYTVRPLVLWFLGSGKISVARKSVYTL